MANKEGRKFDKKIFTEQNEKMFREIGKEFGCKFLICVGSRAWGNHIDDSDYDFVIVDSVSNNQFYRRKTKIVENKLNIKTDFMVSDKVYPTNGIMLEIN
jgi:predicted nucleotidyltransferase